jgi:hypothetical protein
VGGPAVQITKKLSAAARAIIFFRAGTIFPPWKCGFLDCRLNTLASNWGVRFKPQPPLIFSHEVALLVPAISGSWPFMAFCRYPSDRGCRPIPVSAQGPSSWSCTCLPTPFLTLNRGGYQHAIAPGPGWPGPPQPLPARFRMTLIGLGRVGALRRRLGIPLGLLRIARGL